MSSKAENESKRRTTTESGSWVTVSDSGEKTTIVVTVDRSGSVKAKRTAPAIFLRRHASTGQFLTAAMKAREAKRAPIAALRQAVERLQKLEKVTAKQSQEFGAATLLDAATAEELLDKPRKPKKALLDLLDLH